MPPGRFARAGLVGSRHGTDHHVSTDPQRDCGMLAVGGCALMMATTMGALMQPVKIRFHPDVRSLRRRAHGGIGDNGLRDYALADVAEGHADGGLSIGLGEMMNFPGVD